MPVRPRRSRRARSALTLRRWLDLSIGPDDNSEPLDVLGDVFREHRRRFNSDDWAVGFYEGGVDDREPLDLAEHDAAMAAELPGLRAAESASGARRPPR